MILTCKQRGIIAGAALASAHSLSLHAADSSWTWIGSGSWSTASHWTAGIPAANDRAFITHSDAIDRTVTYDYEGISLGLSGVTIDNQGSGSTILTQSAHLLTTSSLTAGLSGTGYLQIEGGSHNVTQNLIFGSNASGRGIGTLSGGTINGKMMYVGRLGSGTFVQLSGTNNLGMGAGFGTLVIGSGTASQGRYFLNGGTLAVEGSIEVGRSGSGWFEQSGGTLLLSGPTSGELYVAANVGGYGTYVLNSGVLKVAGYAQIGSAGTGAFIQSGGTHTVEGPLFVGAFQTGFYSLSGSGMLVANGGEYIGSNIGTFNQSGGVHHVQGVLAVGGDSPTAGGIGEFVLSGTSILTVTGNEYVPLDGIGRFIQSSGTHTIGGDLVIIGNLGAGTFIMAGGSVSAANMISKGYYEQTAGMATFGSIDGTGNVVLSGGALSATRLRQNSLVISGGNLSIAPQSVPNSPAGTNVVHSLSIAAGGLLDIANNSLIVDYSPSTGSPIEPVAMYIASGRLISSPTTSAATLGFAENALLGYTTFAGMPVDSTSVLVKYTWYGDATLDGVVNVLDLILLANSWLGSGSWANGDFNLDGLVNQTDLGLLARNWQAGNGAPLGPMLEELGLPVPIPEPVWGLGLSCIFLGRRNRRATSAFGR